MLKIDTLDRPYTCNEYALNRNKVWQACKDFLTVEDIPEEYRTPKRLILSFVESAKRGDTPRFQRLVNLCCYKVEKITPTELVTFLSLLLGQSVNGQKIAINTKQLFSLMFYHLSVENLVKIPPVPVLTPPSKSKVVENSGWHKKFSSEVLFWLLALNEKSIKKRYSTIEDKDIADACLAWLRENPTKVKAFSSSAVIIRHHFAFTGTNTFNIEKLVHTRKTLLVLSSLCRSIVPGIEIYSKTQKFSSLDLMAEYNLLMESMSFQISRIDRIYHNEIYRNRRNVGIADPSDFSRSARFYGVKIGTQKKPATSHNKNYCNKLIPRIIDSKYGQLVLDREIIISEDDVLYKVLKTNVLQIGEYLIDVKKISSFSPDKLIDTGYREDWLLLQKDWLESSGIEKSTRSMKIHALKYFNAYLYSYLPWFKENIDQTLYIPLNPDDFNANLFVRRTHSFLKNIPPNAVLPVTFPEFLMDAVATATSGNFNTNVFNSKLNEIFKLFDFYNLLNGRDAPNPMSLSPKPKGFKYQESNKVKIDYHYWLLFREFLFEFADCSCDSFKEISADSKFDSSAWIRSFYNHASERSVTLGDISLSLSKIQGIENIDLNKVHIFSSLICLISFCGIRFSNALWLDAVSFDCQCPTEIDDDELQVRLFVNTDKSKSSAWNSHIPFRVMKLLRKIRDLRSQKLGPFENEKIYYQNNIDSKWGQINPLFRYEKGKFCEKYANPFCIKTLNALITIFENQLRSINMRFTSYLYPSVSGVSYDEYVTLKAMRKTIPNPSYVVNRRSLIEDQEVTPVPICIFSYKSTITLHSFRKTFASFWSMLLGKEATGALFTGQTATTVGYYSSNSPDEYVDAISLSQMLNSSLSVVDNVKDSAAIVEDLKTNGISARGLTIHTAKVDDYDIDNEYKMAPDSEIAVNRTHICPYNNTCPSKIRKILDNKKLCGLCPAALSFPSDAPAIAAKIKQIADDISDLSEELSAGHLTTGEESEHQYRRMDLIAKLSAWLFRHDQLRSMTEGEILIGEDGECHFKHKLYYHPFNDQMSEHTINLIRIFETSDVKTLQSARLQRTAARYARGLIKGLDRETVDKIDIDPVKNAALLVEKTARLNGLTLEDVILAVEGYREGDREPSIQRLLAGENSGA